MSELDPRSRMFVEALRTAYDEPGEEQLERVKRRALAALAVPVAVGAAVHSAGKVGLGAKAVSAVTASKTLSLALAFAVAVTAGSAATVLAVKVIQPAAENTRVPGSQQPTPSPAPRSREVAPVAEIAVEKVVPAVAETRVGAPAAKRAVAEASPSPAGKLSDSSVDAEADTAAIPLAAPHREHPPEVSGPTLLARQLAVISKAEQELSAHRPETALKVLDGFENEYALRNDFMIEAQVVRAVALCSLSRKSEGRELLKQVSELVPDSPYLGRMRTSCDQ